MGMTITAIGPCEYCRRVGIARTDDGADLCYRHAKALLRDGGRLTWASIRDATRAVRALGGTVEGERA